MQGIGWIELFFLLGVLVLMVGLVAAIGTVVWFIVKRRPAVTPGSRTCTHCGQRIPDLGSFCAFCGQKMS